MHVTILSVLAYFSSGEYSHYKLMVFSRRATESACQLVLRQPPAHLCSACCLPPYSVICGMNSYRLCGFVRNHRINVMNILFMLSCRNRERLSLTLLPFKSFPRTVENVPLVGGLHAANLYLCCSLLLI